MRHYLLLLVFFLVFYQADATHLRGGFISAERINGMTYRITITAYTNTLNTPIIFGGGELNFGDGSASHITEQTVGIPRPDLGPGVSVVVYTINHTYTNKAFYTISYRELNRMSGLINLPNSREIAMYFETKILIDPDQNFMVPTPLTDVFSLTCATPQLSMALGLNNPGGLKIRYFLQAPLQNRGIMPPGYKTPASMKLDPFTGLLEWDGKWEGMIAHGDYVVSVVAYCYKESNDGDNLVYSIRQDIQITIVDEECSGTIFSTLPLDELRTLVVPSGTDLTGKIFFQHPNQSGEAELLLYSDAPSSNVILNQFDSTSVTTGKNIRVGRLTVISDEGLNRPEPFLVVIRGLWNSKAYYDFSFALATQPPDWSIITATHEQAPVAYPWLVDRWLTLSGTNATTHYSLLTSTGVEIASGEYLGEHKIDCSLFASGMIIVIQQQGTIRNHQRIFKQ